ncbi:MAG: hypothetical protein LJE68_01025, partial [Rhodobacter sp.]|nr:hypothetical protein [Rhodobacter sp.]
MTVIKKILGIFLLVTGLAATGNDATAQPALNTAFSPSSIGPGATSTLQFTIQNPAGAPVTDLAFTDTLPASVVLATPHSATSSCLGTGGGAATFAPVDGASTISFSDGVLGAGASCAITVKVTSATPGTHTNPALTLSSSAGSSMSLPHDLTVTSAKPGFSKSFSPLSVALGGTSTLTFTIDNSANAARIGNLDFTDTLPTGLVVASPANASTDCV